ncbi:LacI family transcriptional regulator [Paenibacillus antri]|uniref:LacI family transcriptional regulator n=1 Tax=Paenibacillus antri TaxID=2582848 RepID=A0A5R9G2U0_9BACL|nr:LacI family DNA-binding transcriptional regulator [Paenibacillus antri]TLS50672.1 LacI family transcriptional regulator [Paenibacillus antri]
MDIFDIARLAGVSRKTVQRVLNDAPNVSEKTAAKIRSIMEAHNYEPNAAARGLASKRSNTIGLFIVQDRRSYTLYSDDLYFGAVIGAMISRSAERGYKTLVSIEEASDVEPILSLYKQKSIDAGLLVSWSEMQRTVERIAEAGFRIGVFDQNNVRSPVDGVPIPRLDDYGSAFAAAEYLLGLGHTDIGIVTGDMAIPCSAERLRGFVDAVRGRGLSVRDDRIHNGRFIEASGREAIERWTSGGGLPSAVFCSNDLMAYGALKACADRGVSVPGALSVVGFDDLLLGQYTHPPLTTMRVPRVEMAVQLTDAVIDVLEGRESRGERQGFQAELIERESCRPVS